MTITIKELTAEVAATSGLSKIASEKVITELFGLITASLQSNQDVVVRNFGRFYTHTRPARKGRNPRTGAVIDIPIKTVIKLAPRGDLK